jgi:DNA-directed RNA polymerase beta' subunit
MLLNEMNRSKTQTAHKALREHYEVELNLGKLGKFDAQKMLVKVRKLLGETRNSRQLHESHSNASYLKLVMMEQALQARLEEISEWQSTSRVVVESEEVEKSQVILAAQDMVDSIQKMIEQVSKMTAEELPAVVSGIENEIGSNESTQFEEQAQGALNELQTALTTAKSGLKGAMGTITGEGGSPEAFGGEEEFSAELPGGEEIEGEAEFGIDEELPELPELPAAEPEEEPVAGVGRAKR